MPEAGTKTRTIGWEEARRLVGEVSRGLAEGRQIESIPLEDAHGRVLGKAVLADRDYPAVRRSLRDGFAVHASDVPGTLLVRGERRAGNELVRELTTGEALEIMTGAPVPDAADAVVMVEHVSRQGDSIQVGQTAEAGQFINPQGAEARAGETLMAEGTRLDASHIATLAMTGALQVPVYRRPTVAILATGDEIVAVAQQPQPHQIRNSNSFMLAALVKAAGGVPTVLPVAADNREALTALLAQGLKHDMLLVSGGVSAGKYDLVKPCLKELGVAFVFERVRIQPGQPTAFGTRGDKVVFGLPGNPGSTLVTFQVFARLALEIVGETGSRGFLSAGNIWRAVSPQARVDTFLPAHLEEDGTTLRHISWQGSSDVPALAKANVFLVADEERESWAVGDSIRIIPKP